MANPRSRVLVLNWRDPWHPEGGLGASTSARWPAGSVPSGPTSRCSPPRYPGAASSETRDGIRYRRRGGHLTVYLWAALLAPRTSLRPAGRRPRGAERHAVPGPPLHPGPRRGPRPPRAPRAVVDPAPALARFGLVHGVEGRRTRQPGHARYVAVSEVTRSELSPWVCAPGHHHRLERSAAPPDFEPPAPAAAPRARGAEPAGPPQAASSTPWRRWLLCVRSCRACTCT